MAKSKNTGAAPVKKQTTEPTTPAPEAPTTNPPNDPTVVAQPTDKNVADPNVNDSDITETTDDTVTPPAQGAAAQAPVNDEQAGDDEPEKVAVKESMKRAELDAVATEEGLANASKYKDKAAVVAAVERVRAGEVATDVDTELTPVVDNGGDTVEVEVINPFYDLQANKNRNAGVKYKTTETRASELRGHKLVK